MKPAAEFLEEHFPVRAAQWEAAALEALTAYPKPVFPWPWVDLRLEPGVYEENQPARVSADFGMPSIGPRQSVTLMVRCCVDCTWVNLQLPERDAYALIVDQIAVSGPQPTPSKSGSGSYPRVSTPGFVFATVMGEPVTKDWDVPLLAGSGIILTVRNTSDAPMIVRVRGVALVCHR